jgi:hypothetical protein
MSLKPIFIHSLFRTGSTYFWSKFRENSKYYCFYEPFHPVLRKLTIEKPYPWDSNKKALQFMHHPNLDRNKHFEYKKLLRPGKEGIPYFKKAFSFDEFCKDTNNKDAKNYLDYLIENSGGKRPVLKFNRSSFRIKWFKNNYPKSLNIYLIRSPRDQWQSYVSMYTQKKRDVFFTMDLITAGVNIEALIFRNLKSCVNLFEYHSDEYENEEIIYGILNKYYTFEDRYFIFYYIWFYAFVLNVLYADIIVNVDMLSQEATYQSSVSNQLEQEEICGIKFDDSNITKYKSYEINTNKMHEIEEDIQEIILQTIDKNDLDKFFSKISKAEKDYLHDNRNTLAKNEQAKYSLERRNESAKYFEGFKFLADHCVRLNIEFNKQRKKIIELNHEMKLINNKVVQKDQQLNKKDRLLEQKKQKINQMGKHITNIYSSNSYRIGKIAIFPFSILKKIVKRIK